MKHISAKVKRNPDGVKTGKYLWLSFGCCALIMVLVYLITRILPFGEITILRMDLYHQYGPLFAELYEKVIHAKSLSYSWLSGLGSCFLGNFFNYLSSPLTAIVMFFGHKNVPEAIAMLVLLKAALSATAFTYYIKHSLGKINYSTVAFSVMYAFCGYFIAYYWNIMWIDAMVLLPIVALGIERIFNTGRIRTYTLGLALTMLSNYYMSFMMCVFSVIYFFLYFYAHYENGDTLAPYPAGKKNGFLTKRRYSRFFRSGIKFAAGSILAAMLIAFALLPTSSILSASSATSGTLSKDMALYFNFFDFFANHLTSVDPTIRSSGEDVLPNVFCGMMTVILIPLYVMTKTISKKEKITGIIGLFVFYIGFNNNAFNFFWHGLHFPNDLPYRQSFMYSFLLLVMAYKTFIRLHELTSRQIAGSGIGVILFIILVEKIGSKNFTSATLFISLAFAFFYTLLLIFFKDKRYTSVGLSLLMLVCACSEVLIGNTSGYRISVKRDDYVGDYDDFQDVHKYLDTLSNGDFYRMELTYLRARMDPCWFNYNGVSTFSSMAYETTSKLMNKLGLFGNKINSYTYYPQTPVFNSLFSLQYIVNNTEPNVIEANKDYYKYLTKVDKYTAYENLYCLPIGFCADKKLNNWSFTSSDPFEVQGSLFALASGEKNPFEDVKIDYATYSNIEKFTQPLDSHNFTVKKTNKDADGSVTFYITPEKSGNIYLYANASGYYNSDQGEGSVTVESPVGTFTHNLNINGIMDIGYQNKGDLVTIKVSFKKESKDNVSLNFYVVSMDDAVFKKGFKKLEQGKLEVSSFSDTEIKGTYKAKKDSQFFTSIPYDKGWQVYVDGKQYGYAEYEKNEDGNFELKDDELNEKVYAIGNGLLSFDVPKGEHEIVLRYQVKSLKQGFVYSFLGLLLICLYFLLKKTHLLEKLPTVRKSPAYPPYTLAFTNDLFLCGNEPYETDMPFPAARKEAAVRYDDYPIKEIITPQRLVIEDAPLKKESSAEKTSFTKDTKQIQLNGREQPVNDTSTAEQIQTPEDPDGNL